MSAVVAARRFSAVIFLRLLRDRMSLFFMVALPVLVIVIIGITFGQAGRVQLGVVDGQGGGSARAAAFVTALRATPGTKVVHFATADDLRGAVRRHSVDAGVLLPDDVDAALAAGTFQLQYVALSGSQSAMAARDVVDAAVAAAFSPRDAARVAAAASGTDVATAEQRAAQLAGSVPAVQVQLVYVGAAQRANLSRFSLVAPQELVLFVFINSLASGAALVRLRRTGVLRRVLAGPTASRDIIAGLLVAWFALSLLQTALLLAVGALGFGVDWGSPLAVAALAVLFSLVGSSAGLMVGALGGDEDRVSSISPPVGIVMGALGGCMVPLEIFSSTMRGIAHVTPHYWAMTAWQRLVFDGAGIAAIRGSLAALAGFAAVFLVVAVMVLRRRLTTA